jgi:peptide/nickel transport system ATP-binding protein
LLRVSRLNVNYALGTPPPPTRSRIDFAVARGEIIGILGESGCGKSTLALSLLGLLPATASVEGSILFENEELLGLDESRLRAIRGAKISLIHQDAGLSLSPVMRVGHQISEVIRAHVGSKRKLRRQAVEAILREVQLTDVDRIYDAYPHQLSGGELHRVVIAQALICRPDLVIADEPTRALDVGIQAEVLAVLERLNRKYGTTLIFITHNPALLVGFADRVMVMYAGRIIEEGRTAQLFSRPFHPYTKALLQLIPRSSMNGSFTAGGRLPTIAGGAHDAQRGSHGCAFEPRCAERMAACQGQYPEELAPEEDRRVSCLRYAD